MYRDLATRDKRNEPQQVRALAFYTDQLTAVECDEEAIDVVKEIVAIYQSMTPQPTRELASMLRVLGFKLVNQDRFDESCDATSESLALFRHLAEQEPGDHSAYLIADILNRYAGWLRIAGRVDEAFPAHAEAVDLIRPLADTRPREYAHLFAEFLRQQATSHLKADDHATAHQIAEEALTVARQAAETSTDDALTKLVADLEQIVRLPY